MECPSPLASSPRLAQTVAEPPGPGAIVARHQSQENARMLFDLGGQPFYRCPDEDWSRALIDMSALRGSALGFRNLTNYIARSLLETGGFRPRLHPALVKSRSSWGRPKIRRKPATSD